MSTTETKRRDSRKKDKNRSNNKKTRSQSQSQKSSKKKDTRLTEKQRIDQLVDARVQQLTGKTSSHVALVQKYGHLISQGRPTTSMSKIKFLIDGCRKFLAPTGTGTLRERKLSLSKLQLTDYQNFIREMSSFLWGTQEPRLRLPSVATTISIASGIIHDELGLGFGTLNVTLISDLAGIFDEVKVIEGACHYVAEVTSGTGSLVHKVVGVIDYESNTSLSSFANGLSYDTHKVFSYASIPGDNARCEWHFKSQGIPDLSWIPTTDTSSMVAYWKTYIRATDSGSSAMGFFYYTCTCDFRQVAAV
jgi:hypothetical protein